MKWLFVVLFGFQEFWPNSDLNSSNGSVPRLSNLSTKAPTAASGGSSGGSRATARRGPSGSVGASMARGVSALALSTRDKQPIYRFHPPIVIFDRFSSSSVQDHRCLCRSNALRDATGAGCKMGVDAAALTRPGAFPAILESLGPWFVIQSSILGEGETSRGPAKPSLLDGRVITGFDRFSETLIVYIHVHF